MVRPSKKNQTKKIGQHHPQILVQLNDRLGKRQRFEAMQKLIKPKKKEESSE